MAARLINPGTRHFDSNGVPLSGGKLQFYQPGTTTPKNTYSDDALTVPNPNPVVLSMGGLEPNIFLDGAYRVILKDANDVQIWDRDDVNQGSGESLSAWVPSVSYELNDVVYASDNSYYISLTSPNLGNNPTTSPSEWAQIQFLQVSGTIDPDDGTFIVGNGTAFTGESGATVRTSLGLGAGDSPQFTAVNIGNATDTTITRDSAGVIAVEGDVLLGESRVQSSATDTTAGALLINGAYGWGANDATLDLPPSDSLDALRVTGFWRYQSATTGRPTNLGTSAGVVLHIVRLSGQDTTFHMQIAVGSATGRLATRYMTNSSGDWSDWDPIANLGQAQTWTALQTFVAAQVGNSTNGVQLVSVNGVLSGENAIADDGVISITPRNSGSAGIGIIGFLKVSVTSAIGPTYGIYHLRSPNTLTTVDSALITTIANTVLTGTSGSDGSVSISFASSTNRVYIENRAGIPVDVQWLWECIS